jgi:hypothetical protein
LANALKVLSWREVDVKRLGTAQELLAQSLKVSVANLWTEFSARDRYARGKGWQQMKNAIIPIRQQLRKDKNLGFVEPEILRSHSYQF